MKKTIYVVLIVCILLFSGCSIDSSNEPDIPEHTEQFYVNDYAEVLDYETENAIVSYGRRLEELTGAQLVVLTIESLDGYPLEEFSLEVLRSWSIGQKEENNGVLILLAVDDRKSRIEVGYGLEGALPDGKTGRIQDEYMLPYFSEGDYSKGILEGYKALLIEIYNEYGLEPDDEITATPQPTPSNVEENEGNPIWLILGIIIVLIFDRIFLGGAILRFIFIILFSGRHGGPRGGSGGWGGGGYSGGGWSGGGGSGGGGGSSRSW